MRPGPGVGRGRIRAAAIAVAAAVVGLVAACGGGPADVPTDAVLRVEGKRCGRLVQVEATAAAVAPDLVVTVAHALVTMDGFELIDEEGRSLAGRVVYLDEGRDIALVRVDRPLARHLDLGRIEAGDRGLLVSAGDPEAWDVRELTVRRLLSITLDGEGERQGLELDVTVRSGDSGSPVLTADHELAGMIFASSDPAGRGWAVQADEVADALDDVGPPIELDCP